MILSRAAETLHRIRTPVQQSACCAAMDVLETRTSPIVTPSTGGPHDATSIGYLRVSTQEQGRSGLGLAAQRHEIEAFGVRAGFVVKSWHQDLQTGAGVDALLLRPGLATALKEARAARYRRPFTDPSNDC